MKNTALNSGIISPTQSGLPPFRLYQPQTLREAIFTLERDPAAIVYAGGTDFFSQVRKGLTPEAVLSVRHLSELRALSYREGHLWIGAGVTHAEGQNNAMLREVLPALADAWGSIATVRIRRTGTIGGNLMARQYRYEMSLLTDALQARLEFPERRSQPISWLWNGSTGVPDPLLLGVSVNTSGLVYFGYERSMRPVTTLALALRADPAGITATAAVGSEYHAGFHLRVPTTAATVKHLHAPDVAAALAEQLPPEAADYSGDHSYKRHLVEVLATRLLKNAQHQRTQQEFPMERN